VANWHINLYAILSADDCIADENGYMPTSLMNEADWKYFQAELDTCSLIVIGRRSHEAAPNTARRQRVVMSSQSLGLENRGDAHWWNPRELDLHEMLRVAAPQGGKIGVPGGQPVFDYFLKRGFDCFHLSRARKVLLPGGKRVFGSPEPAEILLARLGLVPAAPILLDGDADMTLTLWNRQQEKAEE